MIRNYLIIGLRNLWKRKGVSTVNLLGLATGMAVCLIIVMYIQGERGYDAWVPDSDNIYRVVVDRKYPERSSSYSFIPQSYAGAMQAEFPGVKAVTRVFNFLGPAGMALQHNDKTFERNRAYFVDSNFFDVFPRTFLAGNREKALHTQNALVLTEATAVKMFGSVQNALGKQVTQPDANADELLEVTGVCENWPAKSHMHFDLVRTTAGTGFTSQVNYVNFAAHTYLRTDPTTTPAALEARFPALIQKLAVTNIEQAFGISFQEFQKAGNGYRYYLQPLKSIYLNSHLEGELLANGSRQSINMFTLIAIAIFIIACINFINLSTARSAERAREVGLRKTFGSLKEQLIAQFLTESLTMSLLSAVLAIGLAALLMPVFERLTGKEFFLANLFNPKILLTLFGMACFTGVAAGIYPALVLSSFIPVQVLKGKFKRGTAGMALRNALVVFQFAAGVILIICTIVVNQQMRYITGGNLGFNQDMVMVIDAAFRVGEQSEAFKNELKALPSVKDVSFTSSVPGAPNFFGVSWRTPESREPLTGRGLICDEDYASTLGLQLVKGRFLSKDFPTDSLSVVINERAARELGLQEPIDAELVSPDENFNGPNGEAFRYKVVGVVSDFHYQTMHEPVNPLVINNNARFGRNGFFAAIKMRPTNLQTAIADVERVWKKFVKEQSLDYHFLDETIRDQYQKELTSLRMFSLFSTIAIIIACIGLLGLAAYATQQKMHEISVRKVLGASVGGITFMLSRDFLRLVIMASLLAFPVAWLVMRNWLNDFSYRIDIEPWIFMVATGAALLIAFGTVSVFTIKAALRNPINSLRAE